VLIAYALYGPQTVTVLAGDGPFDLSAPTATFAALALSLGPAAYCARWFAVSARAQLGPSHSLSAFADAVRPRLAAALAAYPIALTALLSLLAPTGAIAGPAALGLLLFTARLLSAHGHPGPATAGLAAACAAEALTLAAAPLGLSPGGTTAQTAACAAAALALTLRAFHLLPHPAAHRPTTPPHPSGERPLTSYLEPHLERHLKPEPHPSSAVRRSGGRGL
jgi:hypothetical protein